MCSAEDCDDTLVAQGVRELLLDESGDLTKSGASQHKFALVEIKRISNEHRINIVAATVSGLDNALKLDAQLYSRFRKRLVIPLWTESQDFRQFLCGYETFLPFPERSYLDSKLRVQWLLRYGESNTDAILELVKKAALFALGRNARYVMDEDFESALNSPTPPPVTLLATEAAATA
jgi:hypothetical protein